ncbi:MAG: hydrolase [Betaproteobacteria bacterium]|nr:hydrolase [Betaproteobacteria bacterium]MBL8533128.1 hydrolase [Betaproteobacteria bacterium]
MALLHSGNSALVVIDVQERLFPHIDDCEQVLDRCLWLVRLAKRLGVPVLASEQNPQGLGPTVAPLATELPKEGLRHKMHFSCVADGCFEGAPGWSRHQIVLCGTEAHICVFQTAVDLMAAGRQVYVVAEAVGSRLPESKALALSRLRQHGAEIVNGEMVGFEWLRRAGDDKFREINRQFFR